MDRPTDMNDSQLRLPVHKTRPLPALPQRHVPAEQVQSRHSDRRSVPSVQQWLLWRCCKAVCHCKPERYNFIKGVMAKIVDFEQDEKAYHGPQMLLHFSPRQEKWRKT